MVSTPKANVRCQTLPAFLTLIGTLLCMLLISASAQAGPVDRREEGASANSLGVADAVRSSASGPAALFFNPAGMHQFMSYAVETGYTYSQPLDGHVFSIGIVDSATNGNIAAGVSYTYIHGNEAFSDTDRTGHNVRFALASGYRGKDWSLHAGVGGRYLDLTIGGSGEASAFTLDSGLLFTYNGMFRLGVVGHNLLPTNMSEARRAVGLGTSFYYESLLIGFDAVLDFETFEDTKAQLNAGIEYAIGGRVPIRVGFQHDQVVDRQYVTGGIGYVSRIVAADFGFAQSVENPEDNVFSINVRVFIP